MDGHTQLICCAVDGESKLGWQKSLKNQIFNLIGFHYEVFVWIFSHPNTVTLLWGDENLGIWLLKTDS